MNTEDFSVVTGRAPRMVYYLFTTTGRIYGARLDGERLLFKRLSRWSPGRVYGLRGCPSMQVLSNCRFIIRFWVCQWSPPASEIWVLVIDKYQFYAGILVHSVRLCSRMLPSSSMHLDDLIYIHGFNRNCNCFAKRSFKFYKSRIRSSWFIYWLHKSLDVSHLTRWQLLYLFSFCRYFQLLNFEQFFWS